MKYLKSWLQDYIEESLPKDEVIKDILNKKAFEVEEVISLEGDTVFDIKVLPNRAHDALGHKGMAYELCADLGLTRKEINYSIEEDEKTHSPKVEIDDAKFCTRFMSVRIDNVKVGKTPKVIKERLEAIGQRSINNIVDITNYVQFSLNKPMHAYDARSIEGTLRTRFAEKDETLITLDDKELKLNTKTLVIADDKKVLGLAGIKGGKYSGIEDDTVSVILESANFAPSLIRKTAEKYGYKTDASKRFENGIANSLVEAGLLMTASLIKEHCGTKTKTKISKVTDIYPKKDDSHSVEVRENEINEILGTRYSGKEIETAFKKLAFEFVNKDGVFNVTIPDERLDIRIKEDVVEEVGRIIGFDTITPSLPKLNRLGLPHKRMFYENKIKSILATHGFSEIYTYTFGNVGEVKLVKGLAGDKEKLRMNLGSGVLNALSMNLHNAPILATDTVRVFEFGNVFTKDSSPGHELASSESRHLALAIDDGRKKSLFTEEVDFVLAAVKKAIGAEKVHCDTMSAKPYCIEIDFDALIAPLPEPSIYEPITTPSVFSSYTSISPYPFIARDIAMWVPSQTTWESINDFLVQNLNPLIVRIYPFDTFIKKGEDGVERKSIAFRMVYQSYDRTLTDDEVNVINDEITKKLIKKGYEIR